MNSIKCNITGAHCVYNPPVYHKSRSKYCRKICLRAVWFMRLLLFDNNIVIGHVQQQLQQQQLSALLISPKKRGDLCWLAVIIMLRYLIVSDSCTLILFSSFPSLVSWTPPDCRSPRSVLCSSLMQIIVAINFRCAATPVEEIPLQQAIY